MSESLRLGPLRCLNGSLRVPGDKSISHRALLLAALAEGESRIRSLAPGEDTRSTRRCLEALGVPIRDEGDEVIVEGRGWSALDRNPAAEPLVLDCGNSGTTARLLLGVLAGRRGRFRLTGDASLSGRPMARVIEPLVEMGARIESSGTLPATVEGRPLRGVTIETRVASAQLKSALLLAALQAQGESQIGEARLSRDHTERMLVALGAPVERSTGNALTWRVQGSSSPLRPACFAVPGDPSSAACALALALSKPGSDLQVQGICVNETRIGFLRLLERMGATCKFLEIVDEVEATGTLQASGSVLSGIDIGPEEVVAAIDELPLIACVGAIARAETRIRGAGELRYKESDRIAAVVALLRAFGVRVDEYPDGLCVHAAARLQGARVDARGDHRIAMCAAFLAAHAEGESELSGHEWVRISYPEFFADLERLGK